MANDPLGVKMLYPTKTNGEVFYHTITPDSRMDAQDNVDGNNNTGFYLQDNQQARINVFTTSGYQSGNINKNHGQIKTRGYMQSPNDWRDIEATIYLFFEDGDGDDQFVIYCRGGKHTGSNNCEGFSYKGDLYFSGKTRFAKEQYHVSYVFSKAKSSQIGGGIRNRWVGFKFVCYNMALSGGLIAVKMEIWIDKDNNNTWTKVDEYLDKGGWGSDGDHCNADRDVIGTWGGPITTFRWDNVNEVRWKNVSVREISPTGQPDDGSGGGDTTTVTSTLKLRTSIATFQVSSCSGEIVTDPTPTPTDPPPTGEVNITKRLANFYDIL